MVKDAHIHLPNSQFIPNDRSGCSLKHAINAWLTANSAPAPDIAALTQPAAPTPFHHNSPPHATLSFEAVWSEVHMMQITDTAPENLPNNEIEGGELYNLFKVLTMEKVEQKKCDSQPPRP